MKNIFTALSIFILVGCMAQQFTIKEADTRFSEDKNPLYLSEGNRISTKSIVGGTHIDDKGVFINPFVSKDRKTGAIKLLGFNIVNKTGYDTNYGSPNQLGTIKEVTFSLSNGKIISLTATNQNSTTSDNISYNSVSRSASYDKNESAIVSITKEQLKQLASSKQLLCKIVGTKRSVVYEQDDISSDFLVNINKFYTSHVK